METFKQANIPNTYDISINDDCLTYFGKALKFARDHYSEDLERISNTRFQDITPEKFFAEYVWCVMVSGFRAKTVSKLWDSVMESLASLSKSLSDNALEIDRGQIAKSFLGIFNNERKLNAILKTHSVLLDGIKSVSWETFRDTKLDTREKLQELPFIGPVLSQHLHRNLGHLDTIKEDLHLVRVAKMWGFENPIQMCETIKERHDLPLGIIDTVLFYALASFGSRKGE